jgi:hypothetical protein
VFHPGINGTIDKLEANSQKVYEKKGVQPVRERSNLRANLRDKILFLACFYLT